MTVTPLVLSSIAHGCLALSRCCLVLPFVLLFIYISNYDVTMQSATFPATSEWCCDVKEKMHISMRYEKNNQVPVLNADRQISISGDTMSHHNLSLYLWHCITLDWDLSVCVKHWYWILLVLQSCQDSGCHVLLSNLSFTDICNLLYIQRWKYQG